MTKKNHAPTTSKPQSQDKPLKVGDMNLVLRFSMRAILALRDKWDFQDDPPDQKGGKSGDEKVVDRIGKQSIGDFVTILWAATRTHHPELTEEDILALVDDAGLEGLQGTLNSVVRAGAPPEDKTRPRKAAASETR